MTLLRILSLALLFTLLKSIPAQAENAPLGCFKMPTGLRFSPSPSYFPLKNIFFLTRGDQRIFKIALQPYTGGACNTREAQQIQHIATKGDYWCQNDKVKLVVEYSNPIYCRSTVVQCAQAPGAC